LLYLVGRREDGLGEKRVKVDWERKEEKMVKEKGIV
jgi:hypothetical protein